MKGVGAKGGAAFSFAFYARAPTVADLWPGDHVWLFHVETVLGSWAVTERLQHVFTGMSHKFGKHVWFVPVSRKEYNNKGRRKEQLSSLMCYATN